MVTHLLNPIVDTIFAYALKTKIIHALSFVQPENWLKKLEDLISIDQKYLLYTQKLKKKNT